MRRARKGKDLITPKHEEKKLGANKMFKGCGVPCHFCKKEHTSNEGGWIINAEHKVFCETHTEGVSSCFDKYLKRRTVTFQ